MRVLFLTTSYPDSPKSHANIFLHRQALALARCGVDIEVVAPVHWVPPALGLFSKQAAYYLRIPRFHVLDNIPVYRPRFVRLAISKHVGAMRRHYARGALSSVKQKPDLVHAHFAFPPGLAALDLAKHWGGPTVLTLRGSDVNVFPERSNYTRRLFIEAIQGNTAVIAVSEALAERTEQIAGIRPVWYPVGVDLRAYENLPSKLEARERLRLPSDRHIILFVGHLREAKGVRELLAAVKHLRADGIVTVMVGDGPLREEVTATPGVVAVGSVPSQEVAQYYAAADLFVLPTYREGTPNVVIEAGACGVPVIATRVGGIPAVLAEDRGMLIEPKSSEAIVEAVRSGLAAPDTAAERAKKLRSFIGEQFDIDRNARKLKQLYETLIATT